MSISVVIGFVPYFENEIDINYQNLFVKTTFSFYNHQIHPIRIILTIY